MTKKLFFATVILVAALIAMAMLSLNKKTEAFAEEPREEAETDIPDSVEDLLDKLDLGGVQGIVGALDSDQISVFGFSDIKERVRAIAEGDHDDDAGGMIAYVFALLGANVTEYIPMMLSVLAIVLAYNLINSVKSRVASQSIEQVAYFATGLVALCLIVAYFSSALSSAVKLVASLKNQINAVVPVILTLMTAAGATSSASVYAPSVAILGSGMTNAVTYLAFPVLLMALVFDIIGSISTAIKLEGMADFFRSICKWLLGTAFFIFVTFIGVSGITASVRDGISVRAARFAVSKYVPVIGGYLSQGFDFLMAGNVLIKNALGSSAVALIVLSVAPVIAKLVIFTLSLKLTAALAEPLGGNRFSSVLTAVSKSSSVITAVVAAMVFLYILFLSMLLFTGNAGL